MNLVEDKTYCGSATLVIGGAVLKIGRAPVGKKRPEEQQRSDQGRNQQRAAERYRMKEWRTGRIRILIASHVTVLQLKRYLLSATRSASG